MGLRPSTRSQGALMGTHPPGPLPTGAQRSDRSSRMALTALGSRSTGREVFFKPGEHPTTQRKCDPPPPEGVNDLPGKAWR